MSFLGDVSLKLHGWGEVAILIGEWILDEAELFWLLKGIELICIGQSNQGIINGLFKLWIGQDLFVELSSILITILLHSLWVEDDESNAEVSERVSINPDLQDEI